MTDTIQALRPYFRGTTAEIREVVDTKWSEPDVLYTVYNELIYRERRAARLLRELIEQHLKTFDGYFRWPTTEVSDGSDGRIGSDVFAVAEGMLGFMGYRVGVRATKDGVTPQKRRAILEDAYLRQLPPVNSTEYMAGWGKPRTATRLKKIADAIASQTQLAKRKSPTRNKVAIQEWESDLAYLKRKFYDSEYSFKWPRTNAG